MKFGFVEEERGRYPVPLMCRVLDVSRSGYYAWRSRNPSGREAARVALLQEVRSVYKSSQRTYGSPRIHAELRARGLRHSRRHIAYLMRSDGLRARASRRRRQPAGPPLRLTQIRNVLARRFAVHELDRVWAADLTYVPTAQGWLYLAILLDLASRRVVGWAMSGRPDPQLTIGALEMAMAARRPAPGLLHHSDRGVHYSCTAYLDRLEHHRLTPSLSRLGDCWDNAVVESFFHTLKVERLKSVRYRTRTEARQDLFEYIEVWYNRQRRHSTLGYLSPAEFERRF